jgi:hypothetical protein
VLILWLLLRILLTLLLLRLFRFQVGVEVLRVRVEAATSLESLNIRLVNPTINR